MASCKFVLTLVKDDFEDDYLRETWRSLVVLRGAYLYHVNKLRRKRNSKRLRVKRNSKPTVESEGSGRAKKGNLPQSKLPDPKIATGVPIVPTLPGSTVQPPSSLRSEVPESLPVILPSTSLKPSLDMVPGSIPPPSNSKILSQPTTTVVTTSKSWVDIVSPPKLAVPSQPSQKPVVTEKEVKDPRPQPPNTSGEKGERKDPPKTTETETEKKQLKKPLKISSSASSSSEPKTKKKPALARSKSKVTSEIDFGRYRQMIRDFSRQGLDVKGIKKLNIESDEKLKLYGVWVGRSLGIYRTWDECKAVVDKYQGSRYKKFEGTLVDILKDFNERLGQVW